MARAYHKWSRQPMLKKQSWIRGTQIIWFEEWNKGQEQQDDKKNYAENAITICCNTSCLTCEGDLCSRLMPTVFFIHSRSSGMVLPLSRYLPNKRY